MRAPVWGLPDPLSVNVIIPARSTPLGESTFVNLTPTVHDAPGARGTPVQVSDPATMLKKYVRIDPPETAILLTFTEALPAGAVLVNVIVPVPVMVPVGNVILNGFGAIDTADRVAVPVPVNVTGEPVTVAPV